MPSRSRVTGQSDIWDLSDYFPPGEPWETSFNWYKDQYTLTSVPYAYYFSDTYGAPIANLLSITFKDLNINLADDWITLPAISSVAIRESTKTYSHSELPYTVIPSISSVEVRSAQLTYSMSDRHAPSLNFTSVVLKNAITYSFTDSYAPSLYIVGVTIT